MTIFHSLFFLQSSLLLSLAVFAFILQWHDEINYQTFKSLSLDNPEYPSMDCTSRDSRTTSFPYFKDLKFGYNKSNLKPKICITTTTSDGLEQILQWIYYHKFIGVTNFFLFVEGNASIPHVSKVLQSIQNVKLVHRTKELEEEQAKSRMWNETWMSRYLYKPCNYELFVKQYLNMEMAIDMAREARMDWIIHIDTDELIHPAGTNEYSVTQLLSAVHESVDTVIFPNYESCVERDDIQEPFTEVSLFKKSFHHLDNETYFRNYNKSFRGNKNYFMTYANGKSAARVQPYLRPNGAHRWYNYITIPNETQFTEAAILHYTYAKFSYLTSRRERCGCKPTINHLKKCFFLDFDRDAFIIASSATEEEMLNWYHEHVVWMNKDLNQKLIKEGILTRIYAPMVIMQGLKDTGVYASLI
ncbi:hypothetical protein QVD17_17710 [Tagetes erecta]|uniref:Glycosyltransferase family 92 protein n=1 Tax=Tagetes erecta TaxID=13708 RepID=A0AAD8KSR6_TARER|nr:hypothetical protein QVD17_17710 [Tagetes erecta]